MEAPSRIWRHLIDALIPPRRTERLVRATTAAHLARLRHAHFANGIEALLPYDDARVAALIWELKYYGSAQSVALLGSLLSQELSHIASDELSHRPLIIPIPLHPKREKARGFNQMERVARCAALQAANRFDYGDEVLVRVIDTPRQTALPRTRRLTNLRGAFSVLNPSAVAGRTCILVDDVVTTGSTLKTAGATLSEAGAAKVILVALAHAG